MSYSIKFKLLNSDAIVPKYESEFASGLDLRALNIDIDNNDILDEWDDNNFISILPVYYYKDKYKPMVFKTGLSIEIPQGLEGQIRPRSGLAFNYSISVINTPGTIDSDYRGEIKVALINLGNTEVIIKRNERIAQLVICPIIRPKIMIVDNLLDTKRGNSGFGSTGVK